MGGFSWDSIRKLEIFNIWEERNHLIKSNVHEYTEVMRRKRNEVQAMWPKANNMHMGAQAHYARTNSAFVWMRSESMEATNWYFFIIIWQEAKLLVDWNAFFFTIILCWFVLFLFISTLISFYSPWFQSHMNQRTTHTPLNHIRWNESEDILYCLQLCGHSQCEFQKKQKLTK